MPNTPTEAKRIQSLFKGLYDGDSFLDVTIVDSLKNISAAQASKKIFPNANTIWQLVVHMIRWREHNLQRIQGKILKGPDDNYLGAPVDTSEMAWKQVLLELQQSQKNWIEVLSDFKEEKLDEMYGSTPSTYYDLIQGILQHDAYHLGQIVLLKKFV